MDSVVVKEFVEVSIDERNSSEVSSSSIVVSLSVVV